MKKVLAFAFVAGMITFASCTSKPAEDAATEDSTTMTMDTDTMMMDMDTTAMDTMMTDTL